MSKWWQSTEQILEKIHRSSVLAPLLACLVILGVLACVLLSIIDSLVLEVIFGVVIGLLILTIIFAFIYFMFRNPQLLRSEQHVIQSHALNILGDERNQFNTNAEHVLAIVNERNPILPTDRIAAPEVKVVENKDNE